MHVYSWQRFVCFMLMLIALWIGTQWNCNNCVLAKGSVKKKKRFTRERALSSEPEERQQCAT